MVESIDAVRCEFVGELGIGGEVTAPNLAELAEALFAYAGEPCKVRAYNAAGDHIGWVACREDNDGELKPWWRCK